jgi:RNA polymerase sigma-70 factor (ECF subfamily)
MAPNFDEKSQQLERFREYLSLLARLQLDPRLQSKVDLSGVVQQTLLEAHAAAEKLAGLDDGDLASWLRRILTNNLLDEVRKYRTQARNTDRERPLEVDLEASSERIEGWLAAEQSSPSQRAMRNEDLLRLAGALAKLPREQCRAVELHHLKGLGLNDIAEQMDRTKGSVAALLFRGLKKLRELMRLDDED